MISCVIKMSKINLPKVLGIRHVPTKDVRNCISNLWKGREHRKHEFETRVRLFALW